MAAIACTRLLILLLGCGDGAASTQQGLSQHLGARKTLRGFPPYAGAVGAISPLRWGAAAQALRAWAALTAARSASR